jgi:hypothetical protein
MKHLAVAIFFVLPFTCRAEPEESWVVSPPMSLQSTYAMPELALTQFSEVPVSLREVALQMLLKTPIVALNEYQSQKFGKSCDLPKRAYLVRAVFEHRDTGRYYVKQLRETLWVLHYALGPATTRHRSALVVCTDIAPRSIYVNAGGAL